MQRVLIIGAGGVGNVVAHKCAQLKEVFTEIHFASRTASKCDEISDGITSKFGERIISPHNIYRVDADSVSETCDLIQKVKPDLIINVALPYQDIPIMDACLEMGVNYMDTALPETLDNPELYYKDQWAYHDQYSEAHIMGLLGCGFDPGVTSIYVSYAAKHFFDEIHYLDIVDCNAGDHGKAFATNFNPETNIREILMQPAKYWEDGEWKYFSNLSKHQPINYPNIGEKESYMMYHEELESIVKFFPTIKKARFWMTFGEQYINYLDVLKNVGMTRIDEVELEDGRKVVPLKVLKTVLPKPGSLGVGYTGKTCIGCMMTGVKDGKDVTKFIYNSCDHVECFKEVGSQAISYTTGVPAMIGAKMIFEEKWNGSGIFNVEQFDPVPFMDDLNKYGLPWQVINKVDGL